VGKFNLMKQAVFFDRDGVINDEVYNKKLQKWTAPHSPNQIKIKKTTISSLKKLKRFNFLFFVISNQPDYATGLVSLKKLKLVHKKIKSLLHSKSIFIKEFFYSYKHPESKIKNYGPPCFDRKPNPFFLKKAKLKYNLNLDQSWIIGDRQTDIECGIRAGVKTIALTNKKYNFDKNKYKSDFFAKNFKEAIDLIIRN